MFAFIACNLGGDRTKKRNASSVYRPFLKESTSVDPGMLTYDSKTDWKRKAFAFPKQITHSEEATAKFHIRQTADIYHRIR